MRTGLLIGLAAGVVLLSGVMLLRESVQDSSSLHTITPEAGSVEIAAVIEAAGAEKAYGMFLDALNDASFSTQHLKAHEFGQALYESTGLSGVTVCGPEFGFGCYHQFFLSAIAEHGPEAVYALDEACVEAYGVAGLGCTHGIGHGLMEYYGAANLDDALDVCGRLTWQESLLGCQDGVFMEYNFPTIITPDSARTSRREPDPQNMHAPCDSLDARFRQACYFAQSAWWSGQGVDPAVIGEHCREIASEAAAAACWKGYGDSIVLPADFVMSRAISACEDATEDAREALLCRSGIYWGFWKMDGTMRESASAACAMPTEEMTRECIQEADITGLFFSDYAEQE